LRFLSRLFRAVLGIVPFRRTLFHPRPYTFKQTGRYTLPQLWKPRALNYETFL
jgi:hypothetical protein